MADPAKLCQLIRPYSAAKWAKMQKEEKLRMKQSLVFAPISLILTHVTAWSVPGYPHISWDREKGGAGGMALPRSFSRAQPLGRVSQWKSTSSQKAEFMIALYYL